jgi:hypothetical protein
MKGLVAAVVAMTMLLGTGSAGAAVKRPAVTCHWVKATKKRKRHKVCVKVKAKSKATKKTTPAVAPTPAAPVAAPAPVAAAPVVAPALTPAPVVPPVTTDPGPVALTRLQTTSREWSLTLSRPSITAGALSLQLVNAGEDAHDLHVRPASGGADVLSASSTEPGTTTTISGSLPAGTYTLYCSLPGHEAAGMHATLTVTAAG